MRPVAAVHLKSAPAKESSDSGRSARLAPCVGMVCASDPCSPNRRQSMHLIRRRLAASLAAIAVTFGVHAGASAETVARYGISMADIPLTTGQPDRGAGAYQF